MTAPAPRPPTGRFGRRAAWPDPPPHPSGATPPSIPVALVPKHVAIVMDGNGRWAHARGLSRTEGHRAGEASLMDVLHGAIELGVGTISAYAFSTENWRRSPEEVRFLMGFNKDVIRRRRDELAALGVRIRWAGRRPRLWRSVISQLEDAEQYTRDNDRLTLQFCVNYGGRAEIVDAVRALSKEVQAGRINPAKIDERTIEAYLDEPGLPDVDLFIRTSGRAADVELPALAVRLRRARLRRHAVARLRPSSPVAGVPGLCTTRSALRRSRTGGTRRRSRTGGTRRRSRTGGTRDTGDGVMIAVTHFRSDDDDFEARARTALGALAARPGYERGTLGRSTDDPSAWMLLTEWENIGSYRRALGAYEVKLHATPLLADATRPARRLRGPGRRRPRR